MTTTINHETFNNLCPEGFASLTTELDGAPIQFFAVAGGEAIARLGHPAEGGGRYLHLDAAAWEAAQGCYGGAG